MTLETELASVLREAGFSRRQAHALAVRLGWDGEGGSTLLVAAEAEGCTRERVRQLEQRLRRRSSA
jgi:DNA-directed RNA polymerase sigma subunit (sigma70/sigma32)